MGDLPHEVGDWLEGRTRRFPKDDARVIHRYRHENGTVKAS
jgi:hypothetical protein